MDIEKYIPERMNELCERKEDKQISAFGYDRHFAVCFIIDFEEKDGTNCDHIGQDLQSTGY